VLLRGGAPDLLLHLVVLYSKEERTMELVRHWWLSCAIGWRPDEVGRRGEVT
jgi:hypothetical protein